MPDFRIWCDMHTRLAIYKRYVEYWYTHNMDGSMSICAPIWAICARETRCAIYPLYMASPRRIQGLVGAPRSIWQSPVIPWRRSRPMSSRAFLRLQRSWRVFQTMLCERLLLAVPAARGGETDAVSVPSFLLYDCVIYHHIAFLLLSCNASCAVSRI